MTTADGKTAAPSPPDDSNPGEGEEERQARQELKLCKALAALNPPHHVSAMLHARMTEALRALARHGANDPDARETASLTDEELLQAAAIARAIRTMPAWDMASPTGSGYRFARAGSYRYLLNRYALELGDELEQRARRT